MGDSAVGFLSKGFAKVAAGAVFPDRRIDRNDEGRTTDSPRTRIASRNPPVTGGVLRTVSHVEDTTGGSLMVGVVWAAALLLGSAGIGKLLRPAPTVGALRAVRIPGAALLAAPTPVRLIGAAEILVAAAVLVFGGAISAALLAVSYLLLTVVGLRMLKSAPAADCGCFGRTEEPISRWHIAVDVTCLLIAVAAVIWPQHGVPGEFESQGLPTVVVVGLAGLCAWLGYLLMTEFPAMLAQRAKVAATR